MSLKNQMLIVGKIKSINPNFIPKIEVDSRAAPDERELQFMAELVIAVNNLTNVRNVNKIFFNRQVKSYNHYGPRQQTIRSYSDGSIELYVNLHHHNLNIDQTLSCITSERNQEFIRTRQSYDYVNFVKDEVKDVTVQEVKMNVAETESSVQNSVFGYEDGITIHGDDGESWIDFGPAKTEVDDEVKDEVMNVSMNDEVKDEVVNEDDVPECYAEYAVKQIINHEVFFIEEIDFDLATNMMVNSCIKHDVNVSSEVIRSALIEKVKEASNFGEVPKNDVSNHYKIHESESDDGTYVYWIESDADAIYSVPNRFIPNHEFEVYTSEKYEKMFKSFFDADDQFEYVGIVSTQMYECDGHHFVEHRSLMSRFFSDAEILAGKPADDGLSNEEYIEWARSNDHDRTDRYVIAIREMIL